MNFVDKVRIFARGGEGGDGCLAFHREKYVPMGGPDGGNGGKGGDVWLLADPGLTTLMDFAHHPHLTAKDGANGKGSNKYGAAGEDLVVKVPVGTVVYKGGVLAADLSSSGQRLLAAQGGRGGRGNAAFKTQRNTAPKIAEKGEPGEVADLELELKLLADVGLVGLPNAGKSTFLARVSNARPKIADYPFTTLSPHLGLVRHRGRSFVLADIPGLIEGAHEGKGLGSAFLRHVERTRVLIHLVDPMGYGGQSPMKSVAVIRSELKGFGHGLEKKPAILAVNKADLPEAEKVAKGLGRRYGKVLLVSGVTGAGVSALLDQAVRLLAKAPEPEPPEPAPETHDLKIAPGFTVGRERAGLFEVNGVQVERLAAMTNFEQPEAVDRFQNILRKMGIERGLARLGVRPGDSVRIGPIEFEWSGPTGPRRRRPRGPRRKR